MAELDEFKPTGWSAGVKIEEGKYILQVEVKKCSFQDVSKEKPYMRIIFLTIGENLKDFEFENRVYLTKSAEWRARWFLKDFGYPENLLGGDSPVLKKSEIEGLRGKVLIEAAYDNSDMLRIEIRKFDHFDGTKLEDILAKESKTQEQLPLEQRTDAEPTTSVDVNADIAEERKVQNANDAFSSLDE